MTTCGVILKALLKIRSKEILKYQSEETVASANTATSPITVNKMKRNILLFCIVFARCWSSISAAMTDCYLADGRAQRCLPPFVNAAFRKRVIASNTCGSPAEKYCVQTGVTGVTRSCHLCDSRVPSRSHNPVFLTDLNVDRYPTWWQSSTMLDGVQYPNMVNLTLNLGEC